MMMRKIHAWQNYEKPNCEKAFVVCFVFLQFFANTTRVLLQFGLDEKAKIREGIGMHSRIFKIRPTRPYLRQGHRLVPLAGRNQTGCLCTLC